MKRRTETPTKRTRNANSAHVESALMSGHELHELIAVRAFEIYSQDASTDGDALTNWLRAEAEVLSSLQSGATSPMPSNKPAERSRQTNGGPAALGRVARKKAKPKSAVA
jgi:DUF2934 family protein